MLGSVDDYLVPRNRRCPESQRFPFDGSGDATPVGRYLAPEVVEKSFASKREFASLAGAARNRGRKIVALARLSPIFPFSIGDYAFWTTVRQPLNMLSDLD